MSGFVKGSVELKVVNDPITPEQKAEAEERLGARIGKYYCNRKNGMGHLIALSEAVKP